MPGRRPVAELTVVHVLLIDTFTHSGFYPAGQTTCLCEYTYAFLCATILSGDNRNLPAGRKPERVNEALGRLHKHRQNRSRVRLRRRMQCK
jgi:hypothetical protein